MEVKPVKIYSVENTPRLRFISDLIFNEVLGLSWEIVTDRRKLGKCPVINYSGHKLEDAFSINPSGLLFETGVNHQEIRVDYWKGLPVFFLSPDTSDLPFDIFAAIFFLVTRYEEYNSSETDKYGRFLSHSSVAAKYGFLSIPVIDLWIREMAKSLVKKYPYLTFRRNEFKALLTFDVDEPFAYLGKNILNNIGGIIHDITKEHGKATVRINTLRGELKDPYEVFDYMTLSSQRNKTRTLFFFPVGNHSEYDKNPSWKNENYRKLIKNTADRFTVGLHPSFNASSDLSIIRTELRRFKTITKKECRTSRFHFLKISMPGSFRNLISCGIKEDYSMGYPDECGFRAGIARPFRFYDLHKEIATDLYIFPFQIMDVTLRDYKKLNGTEAKRIISDIIRQIKKVGGHFTSIWHNTSLLTAPEFSEWREVFEYMLKEQSK